MTKLKLLLTVILLVGVGPCIAADLIDSFRTAPGMTFDAERGAAFWRQEVKADDGNARSCQTCHGTDLTKNGKHARTGKPIEPMAHSANAERYTDLKKVNKWFTRNCKWTIGRECSDQEKGDVLAYLLSL